jgi:hypothetical protein
VYTINEREREREREREKQTDRQTDRHREANMKHYTPFKVDDFLNTENFNSFVRFSVCCLFFSSNLVNSTGDFACLSPTWSL